MTDESTKNMVHNNAGIKEVLAKYPDQDFKFFSFPGKPSFAATGRMALDVDDIVDDFEKMYTYRYANGTIYRINATFDSEENTLNFRTNKLDNFFVTNKFIEDGTVVPMLRIPIRTIQTIATVLPPTGQEQSIHRCQRHD
ncbi:MAG: hypothetical protein ACLVJ6_04685 [Merdibacter sp.]